MEYVILKIFSKADIPYLQINHKFLIVLYQAIFNTGNATLQLERKDAGNKDFPYHIPTNAIANIPEQTV